PAEGEQPEQNGDETTSNTPACEGCHERAPRDVCLWIFAREHRMDREHTGTAAGDTNRRQWCEPSPLVRMPAKNA
ncbi:hypothetical protein, partial [Streptomyces olivaceus]|uniref:hypothetical protein n=1 Tax=Streptomyces olivaceus TaxID=47716 RepID=UPI0036522495